MDPIQILPRLMECKITFVNPIYPKETEAGPVIQGSYSLVTPDGRCMGTSYFNQYGKQATPSSETLTALAIFRDLLTKDLQNAMAATGVC